MNCMKTWWAAMLLIFSATGAVHAEEGMWLLNELNKENIQRLKELGFNLPYDSLYSPGKPSVSDAVVIFGGGCTGIAVSEEGLVFTNHHCGYGSIQSLSSVEHDYLKDGFVSRSIGEELPVPGLTVKFLKQTIDVTDRIVPAISHLEDEYARIQAADSISALLCDSIGKNSFVDAQVYPYYCSNVYYLQVYDVFRDVRMVFAPPSSVGKFGGDTDNWMWPRHTGDFSAFRVYAGADNKPADYSDANKPYTPRYVPEISLQGYTDGDYAMTIGFPGNTERYLSSWGIKQRVEHSNKPRIEVRGVKQEIWKDAMRADAEVRIKYSSKYQGSSNYWKNSIGMNRGIEKLGVIARKQAGEAAFSAWLDQHPDKKALYAEALPLLEKGYESTNACTNALTYLAEVFPGGIEIIRLARAVQSIDYKNTPEDIEIALEERVAPLYKDYDASVDRKLMPALMKIAKERIPEKYLPDIFKKIDKKYKGDYDRYAEDVFRKSVFTDFGKVKAMTKDPRKFAAIKKDPAAELSFSVLMAFFDMQQELADYEFGIAKGERLFFAGLKEMYPEKALASDANFTMRMSYGSIGGYKPYDAAWFDYYSTNKGVSEKQDPESDEFYVQPEILALLGGADFGQYGNPDGTMNLCFLSNNDITGGNSGSPVFDKNARLIGLAFDGNWEAMSGDIAFEPDLQRTISVDIRYVLFMIDKWGKCPRLIDELKIVK